MQAGTLGSSSTSATRHNPASVWGVPEAFQAIYAHAVEVPAGSRLLLLSGQLGIAPDGKLANSFEAQCEEAMANVERLLESAGLTTRHLVRVIYYLTRPEDLPYLAQVRRARWAQEAPPAITTLVVAALARPDCLIEIEATAFAVSEAP
jgi:2-iminobutanoate/2-iminopropanoate deaminase